MRQSTWGTETPWQTDLNGWFAHTDEQPWYTRPLARGWRGVAYRLLHRCKPVSVGVYQRETFERCACGGLRLGMPIQFRWHPNVHPVLTIELTSGWMTRNGRHHDIAYLVKPMFGAIPKGTT